MMQVACEADAIPRLATILKSEYEASSPRLTECALLALAALTERWESSRHQLVEANVLDTVVRALSHAQQGVRVAACR